MRMLLLSALLLLSLSLFKTPTADAATALPARPAAALTGSQFAVKVRGLSVQAREVAILRELEAGNIPNFLRHLQPVKLRTKDAAGVAHTATLQVMPDYLAIGSDQDFVRIPMTPDTAQAFAQRFGFMLPTPKIVDEINKQAQVHLTPSPLPAGRQMASTEYYMRHQKMIEKQRGRERLGKLTSGDKKDVVISKRLLSRPSQVAIYGWHRRNGRPVQPLSLVHGHAYADYSHGIRLVSRTIEVDGRTRTLDEVLNDRKLSALVSNEGAFPASRIAYAHHAPSHGRKLKAALARHKSKKAPRAKAPRKPKPKKKPARPAKRGSLSA